MYRISILDGIVTVLFSLAILKHLQNMVCIMSTHTQKKEKPTSWSNER